MDDLRALLDTLEPAELSYVYARSRAKNRAEAFRDSAMGKSKFYDLSPAQQNHLDDLAARLQLNRVLMAEPKLQDAIEDAVQKLIDLMGASNEFVQLNAALAIMDRVMGKVTARVDVTSDGEHIATPAVERFKDVFQAMGQREKTPPPSPTPQRQGGES